MTDHPQTGAPPISAEQIREQCSCWIGRGDTFGNSDEREACAVHGIKAELRRAERQLAALTEERERLRAQLVARDAVLQQAIDDEQAKFDRANAEDRTDLEFDSACRLGALGRLQQTLAALTTEERSDG